MPREHAVRRERLIDALRDGLSNKAQVLWAATGYGKTALLIELASESNAPVCWYSLAPEDNDPVTFLRYCLQSIRTRFPNFGSDYPSLVKSGSDTDWHIQCGFLVSALQSDIQGRLIFLFDDLHWIEGKREIEEVVSLLIQRAPPKIRFVLASRVWPSLACLPKLAASGDLASLDVSDFRFSTEESIKLLTNLWKRPVPSHTAETINQRTGGWAAGILLTAKTSSALDPADFEILDDQSLLFEYLSAEVLDGLPRFLQSFLLRTSVLREFTAAFCDNLLGVSSSQHNIDQIKQRGLFLEERTGQRATFAYHDLFRDYLERRFRFESSLDHEQVNRRAALLWTELGDDDAAIYHYLRIGESDKAVEIIKQVGISYYDQGRWSKLASWLDSLPAHVIESDSEMVLLSGQVLIRTGDLPGASEQFDKLLLRDHGHDQKIIGRALTAKSTVHRFLGHLDLAVSAAQNGLALLEGTDCSTEYIAEAHRQLASSLATQGALDLGKHHFRAALEIAREDNLRLYSLICDGLAVALIEQGQLDEAAVYLEQARAGWLKLGSEGALAETLINLALAYCHKGEFELAFEEASEALRVAELSGYPRVMAAALSRQATVQLALGAYEDALASTSRALGMARELLDQRLVGESTANIGDCYWKMGETSKATLLLTQALLEAEHSDQQYIVATYHIVLGQLYCQEGSYDQASHHLNVGEEQFAEINSIRRIAEVNLYQAAISYRTGKLSDALERLGQVARLTSELGYDGFLLADGVEVLDVLRFGAARRVGGETFIRLVARLTETPLQVEGPDGIFSDTDRPARLPALRAMGFGRPRVLLDSHTIGDVEWRSRKAKEVFFILLCNKRVMSNEELTEALWPEASAGLSDSALKTSIYRLRQAVFYECILAQDTGYRINPAVPIQFDTDDFEEHLRLATQARQEVAAREEHLVKAIELYEGPFLNGVYSEWCQSFRTDLELKFHTALMNLAEYHSARGDFLQSAELLAKVIESDPYNEEAYYRLVGAYIEANEPLTAFENLRKFARLCREELGIQLPQRFGHHHDMILSRVPRRPDTVRQP